MTHRYHHPRMSLSQHTAIIPAGRLIPEQLYAHVWREAADRTLPSDTSPHSQCHNIYITVTEKTYATLQ